MQAFLDAAICFFVPFLAASPLGNRTTIDVFSVGKTIFICMLGVVTMEIMIVARYWTWWFAGVCALSYLLVYPYVIFFPIFWQNVFGSWELESSGVGVNIMVTPFFWIALMTVYSMTFSIRHAPSHPCPHLYPLGVCNFSVRCVYLSGVSDSRSGAQIMKCWLILACIDDSVYTC